MTEEQLKQGNEVKEKLAAARQTLNLWEGSYENYEGMQRTTFRKENGGSQSVQVKQAPHTFTVVKSLNVSYWQDIVKGLEIELSNI